MNTTTPRDLELRPADERGVTRIGWLDSKHSFSFGGYHDPRKMGYHGLRVLNDDRVAPGMGFDTHPHRDMEILTWVLGGELAHKDSMGHASSLGAGGVQLMSAGTGVTHSEYNGRDDTPVHFLQVWINPTTPGNTPRYQEAVPDPATRDGRFAALATPGGREGSLTIGADAEVYVADFVSGQSATLPIPVGRVAYVHVATGRVTINDQPAAAGDAVTVAGHDAVAVGGVADGDAPSQVLAFVLPA
ncbi:MAG: pirin family protein [Planctomycetota bacterium]